MLILSEDAAKLTASERRRDLSIIKTPSRGPIVQLVEHLLCKQGVVGSSPTGSTKYTEESRGME